MRIVLASASPRRIELLKKTGIKDFIVIADTSDEIITPGLTPEEQVIALSLKKTQNVAKICNIDDIVIAADTLVYLDDEPLGKPNSELDAKSMLKKLSGRMHSVYTGVAIIKENQHILFSEKTDVHFRKISDTEMSTYVETGEPMDKAGSYAAQGHAAIFIERIDGDFFNVVGLPICRLTIILKDLGVI